MNRFSRISQNFSGFLKNKLHHVCLLGNAFQQTKNEQNRNFERDRLMLDISGPSLLSLKPKAWPWACDVLRGKATYIEVLFPQNIRQHVMVLNYNT